MEYRDQRISAILDKILLSTLKEYEEDHLANKAIAVIEPKDVFADAAREAVRGKN